MRSFLASVFCGLTLTVLACGGDDPQPVNPSGRQCDAEPRGLDYRPNLEQATAGGAFTVRLVEVEVEGEPRAPDRGFNRWTLAVLDAAGAPVTDAQVRIRPWMPDHGHGITPPLVEAEPAGDVYVAGPFDLFMSGYWEFTVTVTRGAVEESAELGFCVEG